MNDNTKCDACGMELVYHMGVEGTCRENAKLRQQLNTIGAKCGGQGNRVKKLEEHLLNCIRIAKLQYGKDFRTAAADYITQLQDATKALEGEK